MRRLREDPEVVLIALVLLAFVGCLAAIQPKRAVIDAAVRATAARNAERERWLESHPIWRGLRLGLEFEGAVTNAAWQEHRFLAEGVTYVPGRFGTGIAAAPGRRVVARDFLVRTQATWAVWARLDPAAESNTVMRLMDCNGVTIGIEGGRLRGGVFDGQWKEVSVETPPAGAWFHVALRWQGGADDGQVALFLNGDPVRSRAYAGRIVYPYRSLVVGAAHDYTRAFEGVLDESCVFDRALSDAEIAALAWVGMARLRDISMDIVTQEFVAAARAAGGAAVQADTTAPPPKPADDTGLYAGLVLALTFEGGLAGGPGNPPFAVEGAVPGGPGQFGAGGRFDGAASITVPELAITPAGTWAFWARLAGDAPGAGAMRILDVNGTGIQVEGTQLTGFLYEETGTHYVAAVVPTGGWFHVAMTWGGAAAERPALRLYKDGVLVATSDYGGRPGFPVATLKIGCSWDSIRFFHGELDDVCVFTRCLTGDDVAELMNRGLADWSDGGGGAQ